MGIKRRRKRADLEPVLMWGLVQADPSPSWSWMAWMILDITSSPNHAGLRPVAARPCRGSLLRRMVQVWV